MRHAFIGLLATGLAAASPAMAAEDAGSRLILVTLDGMRWQEVFRGPDPVLVDNPAFTHAELKPLVKETWLDVPDRAAALMPFVHDVMAKQGVLYGEQDKGQCVRVSNGMWFSYPGYNEMLTGRPDPTITSNDKNYNRNTTVLEWLNHRPGFAGKVAAVAMWDAFPYIINDKRSGVPVNAALAGKASTDVLVVRQALDTIHAAKPRVLFVSFGDTDELAHAGDYDQYLYAANRTDDAIRQLWEAAQADPAWRGRTTLIVTTDHGRGNQPDDSWKSHASPAAVAANAPQAPDAFKQTGFAGSNEIWFAALGPHVGAKPGGACLSQSQVAATALKALGVDPKAFDPGIPGAWPIFR